MTEITPTEMQNMPSQGFSLSTHLFAFLAGSLSGLAFVQLFGGGWLGLLFAYLCPILLYVSGLGGGRIAAITATAFGIIVVLLKMGGTATAIYALMIAVPAMIISRIALTRINDKWLDASMLLQAALSLGIVLLLTSVIILEASGTGLQALMEKVASNYQAAMLQMNEGTVPAEQLTEAVHMFTRVLPALVTVSWFFIHLLCFGIAQWIVTETRLAKRDVLNASNLSLPHYAAGAFAACALIAGFASGNLSLVLGAVAALLGTGFMLVGLFILHAMIDSFCARKNIGGFGRTAIFGFYYIVLMVLQLPLLLALMVGVADPWAKFRNKLNLTV